VWLARYDAAGSRTWIRQFGTNSNFSDQAFALAPDGAGGVFFAGITGGNLGGPPAGGFDAWLARYDAAGTRLWMRQFGTSGDEMARALAPDSAGGTYVAGSTTGSLFEPYAGGYNDAWLAHYDSAGNMVWGRQPGTSGADDIYTLAPDGAGGVFAGGNGPTGSWWAHYNAAGTQAWIQDLSSFGCLAWDGASGAFVAGWTFGNLGGQNAGGSDAWLARNGMSCYPNCDTSTTAPILNIADFSCFLQKFAAGDPYANCDSSTQPPTLNIADFSCFLQKFAAGCP
jgi:hypothetical protein